MGFTVTEEVNLSSFALRLAGLQFSFKSCCSMTKTVNGLNEVVYRVGGSCHVYANQQAQIDGKNPLTSIYVSVDESSYPADCMAVLYTALKADAMFTGKTLVDN